MTSGNFCFIVLSTNALSFDGDAPIASDRARLNSRTSLPEIMSSHLYNDTTRMSEVLSEMLSALREADEIYKPSPFWEDLACTHIRQLETQGFANFKRTI